MYPETRKVDVADDYHGTRVADPYRWLEDLDSEETAAWVAAQNQVTEEFLARSPLRGYFRRRISELWNYRKTGLPLIEGGSLFYRASEGLEPQPALFRRDRLEAAPALVLDPNAMWPDGTTSLATAVPSPDLRYLAYAFAAGGADWQTIRIRDQHTGQDLEDTVEWMRFSGLDWTRDSRGFFYSRYPAPPPGKVLEAALNGHALYYHRVGTRQADDVLIYTNLEAPSWFVSAVLSEDGRYLLISTARGADNTNRLLYVDLRDPLNPAIGAPAEPLFAADGAECAPIGSIGDTIFARTDLEAPNRRIIAFAIGEARARPDASVWRTVIPEHGTAIESAAMAAGRILLEYLVDVKSRLAMFDPDGTFVADVALPGAGSLAGISGRQDHGTFFYAFTSHLYPTTVFACDGEGQSRRFDPSPAPFDPAGYETVQLFATSTDGTRVPFFVTASRSLRKDGQNPTMLYGYGGFAVSLTPSFRPDVPAWLELGGIWVTANLRGGAEYGEAWHRAGMLERKPQVFDDFIAVAEKLIADGYTSPPRLGIMGGSNGGLLVAAVMEQRPELFAAALPAVGVMDMLRYDRFTGGQAWATEYGSSKDPEEFRVLAAYSPLHNLRPGTCYPATMVVTADHDDRVVPSHSFKFAAALQAAQGCARPALIRVETGGSHNFRSTEKRIAEFADEWTFAAAAMFA